MVAETQHVDIAVGTFTVQTTGEGPRLLNLHGLSGLGKRSLDSAPSGFQVATYDQRGHGNGPRADSPGAYAIDEFVGDALAVLDALGWDRAGLAGQSMGAAVALRLAMDHPDRVERLILTAPAFGATVNQGAAGLGTMAGSLEESNDTDETVAAMRSRLESEGMPRHVSAFVESFREHHFPSLARAIREVMIWAPFPDMAAAASLGIPTVVLGWPDDDLHPWNLAEQLAATLSGPLGRVDGVAVALSEPTAIAAALDELLRGAVK